MLCVFLSRLAIFHTRSLITSKFGAEAKVKPASTVPCASGIRDDFLTAGRNRCNTHTEWCVARQRGLSLLSCAEIFWWQFTGKCEDLLLFCSWRDRVPFVGQQTAAEWNYKVFRTKPKLQQCARSYSKTHVRDAPIAHFFCPLTVRQTHGLDICFETVCSLFPQRTWPYHWHTMARVSAEVKRLLQFPRLEILVFKVFLCWENKTKKHHCPRAGFEIPQIAK